MPFFTTLVTAGLIKIATIATGVATAGGAVSAAGVAANIAVEARAAIKDHKQNQTEIDKKNNQILDELNDMKQQQQQMQTELNKIKNDHQRQLEINQALFIIDCVLMILIIIFQSSIISVVCILMTLTVGFIIHS